MKGHFRTLIYLCGLMALFAAASVTPLPQTANPSGDIVPPQVHPTPAYWQSMLPEGKNRDLVIKRCGSCHDFQRVIAFSRPRAQWQEVVEEMNRRVRSGNDPDAVYETIARDPHPAGIQPEEIALIVDYFTEHFGPDSKPRGLTAMQPCKPSEWPKGSSTFRTGSSFTIWSSNQQGGNLDVIDPVQNKIVRRINCMSAPDRVEFSPDGNTAYVPDRVEHNVTVIDTRTGAIRKKIPLVARPNVSVLTRDGKKLLVGIWPVRPDANKRGYIEVIDTAKLEKVRTLETKGGIHDLWMAKDGKIFLSMSPEARFMDVYDTQTEKLLYTCCKDYTIGTMEMDRGPDGSTNRFFVSYGNFPGIVVIDAKTGKELTRVKHPTDTEGPFAGVEPKGGGFHGNEISSDGKSLWMIAQNIVYRYSLPELKHVGHIHLAELDQLGKPFKPSVEGTWLTISPDGQKVYAARPGRNLVSIIDVATMKEVGRIPTGEYPLHISVWPRGTP
jgi:YVTN family beta-propeller protein